MKKGFGIPDVVFAMITGMFLVLLVGNVFTPFITNFFNENPTALADFPDAKILIMYLPLTFVIAYILYLMVHVVPSGTGGR